MTSFYSPNINYKHYIIKCPSSWNLILFNIVKISNNQFKLPVSNKSTRALPRQEDLPSPLTPNLNYNTVRFLYLYSDVYYFRVPLPVYDHTIHVDSNTSSVVVTTIYTTNYCRPYLHYLKTAFYIFHKPFFNRVKFKGKGYYIYKNKRSTITPQFGHSHRIFFFSYFASVVFLSKTKILIFGFLKSDVLSTSRGIKSMRPINIFTGRGVRFNRQIVFKKTGKVSAYR